MEFKVRCCDKARGYIGHMKVQVSTYGRNSEGHCVVKDTETSHVTTVSVQQETSQKNRVPDPDSCPTASQRIVTHTAFRLLTLSLLRTRAASVKQTEVTEKERGRIEE
jgi:hypothetical protein